MEHDNLDNSSRHLQIYKYRSIADIGRAHLDFDVKCLLFGEAPAMVAAMMMSTNVVKIGCRVLATLVVLAYNEYEKKHDANKISFAICSASGIATITTWLWLEKTSSHLVKRLSQTPRKPQPNSYCA
jgi:hypothetical protein